MLFATRVASTDILRNQFSKQHDEIEANILEERAALETKYQKLYQPFYTKRYEIVTGAVEVDGAPEEVKIEQGENKAVEEKGVPDFWLIALKNNEITAEEITERDEGALKYLKDIKWNRVEEPKGFKLEFFIDENPYFKNTVLTKTYHMIDEDEPILKKAIGIEWYPGNCLTQKILKKKGSKNINPIMVSPRLRTVRVSSNFSVHLKLMDNEKFRSKRQAKNKEVKEG
uniref:Nucleosome assembly protein n=1 Tax=Brassica campestris TaxID=3711 RepID=M4CRW5_BRACM